MVVEALEPIQARYRELIANPDYVRDVLKAGADFARPIAAAKVTDVREKVGLGLTRAV